MTDVQWSKILTATQNWILLFKNQEVRSTIVFDALRNKMVYICPLWVKN